MLIDCQHHYENASSTQIASSSCVISNATDTLPAVVSDTGFTYGEIIISIFVFLTFFSVLVWNFHYWLKGVKRRLW